MSTFALMRKQEWWEGQEDKFGPKGRQRVCGHQRFLKINEAEMAVE